MADETITITKPTSCAPGATVSVTIQNDGSDYGGRSWTIFPSASAGGFSQGSVIIGDATNGNPPSATITWTAPATPQVVTFNFYTLPEQIDAAFGGGDCSNTYSCLQGGYEAEDWSGSVGSDTCHIYRDGGGFWRIDTYCDTLAAYDELSSASGSPRPPATPAMWSYDTNNTGNDLPGLTHFDSAALVYLTTNTVAVGSSSAHNAFLAFPD